MLLSQVSVHRPVLATMMSLGLILFGVIGLARLPVRELHQNHNHAKERDKPECDHERFVKNCHSERHRNAHCPEMLILCPRKKHQMH